MEKERDRADSGRMTSCQLRGGGRKRNLDVVRDQEREVREARERAEVVARIRSDPGKFQAFPVVPQAVAWKEAFSQEEPRYPFLLVRGRSHTGKTEWAKSLFKNPLVLEVGSLEHFPEEMRTFNREEHDAIILDDVRDLAFLRLHQEKLQAGYDRVVEFASNPGGQCAFRRWLFRVPFVATVNYSTSNLRMLETDDFLACARNRVVVEWPPQ